MKKRYQDSNLIVKMFRCLYYVPIPFQWVWCICLSFIMRKITKKYIEYTPNKKVLWELLVGKAQGNMRYYYSSEEVMNKIKEKYKFNE